MKIKTEMKINLIGGGIVCFVMGFLVCVILACDLGICLI